MCAGRRRGGEVVKEHENLRESEREREKRERRERDRERRGKERSVERR